MLSQMHTYIHTHTHTHPNIHAYKYHALRLAQEKQSKWGPAYQLVASLFVWFAAELDKQGGDRESGTIKNNLIAML